MLRPIGHPSRVRMKLSTTSRGVEIVLIGSKYMREFTWSEFSAGEFSGENSLRGNFTRGGGGGGGGSPRGNFNRTTIGCEISLVIYITTPFSSNVQYFNKKNSTFNAKFLVES